MKQTHDSNKNKSGRVKASPTDVIVQTMIQCGDFSKEPVSSVQWIHRDKLSPNLYNPNHVSPPEMALLKTSILEDGWLFALVVFKLGTVIPGVATDKTKHTIIDGFHRWKISEAPELMERYHGYVPCTVIAPANPLATTVRTNRAKGTHAVLPMAEIVQRELEHGKAVQQICSEYGMEDEEVIRLAARVGIPVRMNTEEFGNAWKPRR
ncbi:MAG: ParB N-terminal domain-containing protein [Candidatus Kapabacteria bacterium]|nr:ParB N-terminal domain-containing protein [Candidatus Kapabacteria bacterium]